MTHDVHPRTLWTSEFGRTSDQAPLVVDAAHSSKILVPGGDFLLRADYHRQGPDLVLTGQDGHQVIVRNFFSVDPQPSLVNETGAVIPADLADHLAGSITPGQYAAADGSGPALKTIGVVDKLTGAAKVKHVDGTSEPLQQGSPVYQGDVIETDDKSAVGIVFADRSVFSLGAHGRMVLDELVYDPDSHSGQSTMSVVQGTFSFVSGQIAKASPDAMSVKTPVMTIGIRGTSVAGMASAEGSENTVSLLPDADGGVGQIVVGNSAGSVVLTSPTQTISFSSAFQAPPPPVFLSPAQIQQLYSGAIENRPAPPTQDPHLPAAGTQPTPTQGQQQPGTQQGTQQGTGGAAPSGHVDLGGRDQFTPTTLDGKPATTDPVTTSTPPAGSTGPGAVVAPTGTGTGGSGNNNGNNNNGDGSAVGRQQQAANNNNNNGGSSTTGSTGHVYYAADHGGTLIGLQNGDTLVGASNLSNVILAMGYSDTIVGGLGNQTHVDAYYAVDLSHPGASSNAVLSYAEASVPLTIEMNGQLGTVVGATGVNSAILYGIHSLVGSSGHGGTLDYTDDSSASGGITADLGAQLITSSVSTTTVTDHFQNFTHIVGTQHDDTFLGATTGSITIDGGGGTDILSFSGVSSSTPVTITTGADGHGTAVLGSATEIFSGIESVVGTAGNDTFNLGPAQSAIVADFTSNTHWSVSTNAFSTNYQTVANTGVNTLVFAQYDGDGPAEANPSDWTYTTTASATGLMKFAWNATGFDAWYGANVTMYLFDQTTGHTISLFSLGNNYSSYGVPADYTESGINSLFVNAGDTIGFTIEAGNGDSTATVRNSLTATLLDYTKVYNGGAGDDLFNIESAYNAYTLDGGSGKDTLSLANLADSSSGATIEMLGGVVGLQPDSAPPTIDRFSNFEVIVGTAHDDTFYGNGGMSFVGNGGNDLLSYAHGVPSDPVMVDLFNHSAVKDARTDVFSGINSITGSQGDDLFYGSSNGGFTIDGGGGTDTLNYAFSGAITVDIGGSQDSVQVGSGTDVISNFQKIVGSSNDDLFKYEGGDYTLDGGAGTNTLSLVSGDLVVDMANATHFQYVVDSADNNTIIGNGGSSLEGSGSNDTLTYTRDGSTAAVTVDLLQDTAVYGGATDHFADFATIIGSGNHDVFYVDPALSLPELYGSSDTKSGEINFSKVTGSISVDLSDSNNVVVGSNTYYHFESVVGTNGDDIFSFDAVSNVLNHFLVGGGGTDTAVIQQTFVDEAFVTDQFFTQMSGIGVLDFLPSLATETLEFGSNSGKAGITSVLIDNTNQAAHVINIDASGRNSGQNLSISIETSGTSTLDQISILGGRGDDRFDVSNVVKATVNGGIGNDQITASLQSSTLDLLGGTGLDTLTLQDSSATSLSVVLSDDVANELFNGGAAQQAHGFENFVYGGSGNITAVVDYATGAYVATGSGSDTITGGSGNDTLDGGTGLNTLTGGGGSDIFVGHAGATDVITDFNAASDHLMLVFDNVTGDFGPNSHVGTSASTDGLHHYVTTDTGFTADLGTSNIDSAGNISNSTDVMFDITVSGGGSHEISGGSGNDTITLSSDVGNTDVYANGGDDTIIVDAGATGAINLFGGAGSNTLVLKGTAQNNISGTFSGHWTGFNLSAYNFSSITAAALVFASPTEGLTLNGLTGTASTLIGSSNGADSLIGNDSSGGDYLESVSGHSYLRAAGASTFAIDSTNSAHSDVIVHSGSDTGTIDISDIPSGALLGLARSGNDLILSLGGGAGADLDSNGNFTGGHVTVSHYMADSGYLIGMHGSDSIALLMKGLVGLTGTDAWNQTTNLEIVGTSGNDLMWSGSNAAYHANLYGGGGHDVLVGHANDVASFKLYSAATPPDANLSFSGYLLNLNSGTVDQLFTANNHHQANALTSLDGITRIAGTKCDDTIIGGEMGTSNNHYWVDPYKGDNLIIDTGTGNLVVDYSGDPAGISVDLSATSQYSVTYYLPDGSSHDLTGNAASLTNGYGGTDGLVNIHNIVGSYQADTVKSGGDGIWFEGGAGNDLLDGSHAGRTGAVTMSYQDDPRAVTVLLQSMPVELGGQTVTLAAGGYDGYGGTDTLIDVGVIEGSHYNDTLVAGTSSATLFGGLGDDTLYGDYHGTGHASTLDGGLGNDTIIGYSANGDVADYGDSGRVSGIIAHLETPTQTVVGQYINTGYTETDTLHNISAIIGTSNDDTVIAGDASNISFQGNGGRDTLLLTGTPNFHGNAWDHFSVLDASQSTGGGTIDLSHLSGVTLIGNTSGLSVTLGAGVGSNTVQATTGNNHYQMLASDDGAEDYFDYSAYTHELEIYTDTNTLYVGKWTGDEGTDTISFASASAATAVIVGTSHGDTLEGGGAYASHIEYQATAVGGNYLSDVLMDYGLIGGTLTFDLTTSGTPTFDLASATFHLTNGTSTDTLYAPLGITGGYGVNVWEFANTDILSALSIRGGGGLDILQYSGTDTLTDTEFAHQAGGMDVLKLAGSASGLDLGSSSANFMQAGYTTVDLSAEAATAAMTVNLASVWGFLTVVGGAGNDTVTMSSTWGGQLVASDGNDVISSGPGLVMDYQNYARALSLTYDAGATHYLVAKAGHGSDIVVAGGSIDIWGSTNTSATDAIDNTGGAERVVYHSGGRAAHITDAGVNYDMLSGNTAITADLTGLSSSSAGSFTVRHGSQSDTVTWDAAALSSVTLTGGSGNDLFNVASPNQLANLNLDGGMGIDTLHFTTGGQFRNAGDTTSVNNGHIVGIEYVTFAGSMLDLRGITFGNDGYGGLTGATLTGTAGNDVLGGVNNTSETTANVTIDGGTGHDTLIGGASGSDSKDIFYAHANAADSFLNFGTGDRIYLGDLTVSSGNFVIAESTVDLIGNYSNDGYGHYAFHYANDGATQDLAQFDLSNTSNTVAGNLDTAFDLTLHLGASGGQTINTGHAEASIYGIHSGDQVIAQSSDGIFEWHNPNNADSVYLEADNPFSSDYASDNNTLVLTGSSSSHMTFDLSTQLEGSETRADGLLIGSLSEVAGANARIYGIHDIDATSLSGGNGLYVHSSNDDSTNMTVHGTAYGDTIVGGGGDNYLYGGTGGGDTLIGGTHATGNVGDTNHNAFILDGGANKPVDTILNFNPDKDMLDLPGALYGLTAGLSWGQNLFVEAPDTTGVLTSANIESLIGSHSSDATAALILVGDSEKNAEVWVHSSPGVSYQVATIVGVGNLDAENAIASHISTSATAAAFSHASN